MARSPETIAEKELMYEGLRFQVRSGYSRGRS